MTQKRQGRSDRLRSGRVASARVRLAALVSLALAGVFVWTAPAGATQPYETYENAVAASGPVAQFRFDDAVGSSTIEDSVGSHTYTATNTGLTLGGEGPFPGSRSGWLNGTAYATLPSDPLNGAKEFSAEAWVDWVGGAYYKAPIFNLGSSSSNYMYLTPASSLSEHKMLFEIHPSSGSPVQVTAAKLKGNTWAYLAVTETSAGTIILYLNGEKVGEVKESSVSPASLGSAPNDYLGKVVVAGETDLEGSVSNVAFYTKALSGAQVAEHYADGEFPVNTAAPTVSGTAKEGKKLKAKEGTWSGETPITYSYQWQRCYEGQCEPVAGAKEKEYLLVPADVGYKLRALVAAENATKMPGEASSAETATVEGVGIAPHNAELPKLEGEAREAVTLKASPGKWEGAPPISYTYQWERCNALGEACTSLSGATASTYTLAAGDVGYTLRAKVTAKGALAPTASAISPISAVVLGKPLNTELPRIEGEPREGQELKASEGNWSGTGPFSYEYQWEVCNSLEVCFPEGTASTFQLTEAQVADALRVRVTASNALGSASAVSTATALVKGTPPVAAQAPSISGETRDGQTLTASEGHWRGTRPLTYTYLWRSCNASECKEATGSTYKLQAADVGNTLTVEVTAENAEGSASATSDATEPVQGDPPVNTGPPVIEGEALEGKTLKASEGSWRGGQPMTYTYRWDACEREAGSEVCTQVDPQQHENEYTLQKSDLGRTVNVEVTATNAAGAASEKSDPTGEVQTRDGAVTWGENTHGQLGQIFRSDYALSPDSVEGVSDIKEIAAGSSFNLALLGDGSVESWGGDGHGQLGDDLNLASWEQGYAHVVVKEWLPGTKEKPSEFPRLEGVKQIAVGGEHTVALMQDGTVKAWGINQTGTLGDGTQGFETLTNTNERVARTVEWPAFEKTEKFTVKGVEKERQIKVQAGKLTDILAVAAGGGSDFALTSEHTIMAWGSDAEGQLGLDLPEPGPEGCKTAVTHGNNTEPCSTVPRPVEWTNPQTGKREALKEVKDIAAGEFAGYALLQDGHVVAWGDNHEGQLGTGAPTKAEHGSGGGELAPAEVRLSNGEEGATGEALTGVVELAPGYDDVLARVREQSGSEAVLGWGDAEQGALTLQPNEAPVSDCKFSHAEEQEELAAIHQLEAEVATLEAEIRTKEQHGESTTKLAEKLNKDREKLRKDEEKLESPPELRCVEKATALPRLQALAPQALAAGNNYGLALSQGQVYSWGRNEHGELGEGKVPQNTESGGENVAEAGYPEPSRVQGFGAATAVTAATTHALVLVGDEAERPAPVVSVSSKPLALDVWWNQTPSSGAQLLGEHLYYRASDRKGEPPTSEGDDPGNESGAPEVNPEEPPTITGVEEGTSPAVEGKDNPLKVQHGSWAGARPITYEYQWERCNDTGEACENVNKNGEACGSAGCPSKYASETLVTEDVGDTLRATVIATNSEGEGTATTEATEEVVTSEEEAGILSEVGKKELAEADPFLITKTIEKFPLTEEQKEKGEHKHREVERPLEAVPYELKLATREVVGGESRKQKTMTIIATPQPLE